MIEVTNEMVEAFAEAWGPAAVHGGQATGWRAGLAAALAIVERDQAKLLPHDYLSTACLHGRHDYCSGDRRLDGQPKIPARCKWCSAACRCTCHQATAGNETNPFGGVS